MTGPTTEQDTPNRTSNNEDPANTQGKGTTKTPLPREGSDQKSQRGSTSRLTRALWTLLIVAGAGAATAFIAHWQGWIEPRQNMPTEYVFSTPAPASNPARIPTPTPTPAPAPAQIPVTAQAPAPAQAQPAPAQPAVLTPETDYSIALALAVLVQAANKPTSFLGEIEMVKKLTPDTEHNKNALSLLDGLDTIARTGAPTQTMLHVRFTHTIPDIIKATQEDAESNASYGQSWVARQLERLVTIRPIGMVTGNTTSAIVARAEVHLDNNNLEDAISEAAALHGEAGNVAAPWLEQARARVFINQQINELAQQTLTRFTPYNSSSSYDGALQAQ
ncbi:MAG: mitofilin family membrane protein [Parvularculales bacterium]